MKSFTQGQIMKPPLTPEEILIKQEEGRIHNLKTAKEGSWMCKMFQKHKLSVEEKQQIINQMIDDYKKSKDVTNNEGESDENSGKENVVETYK